jgi:excisionase family DNA binding protein
VNQIIYTTISIQELESLIQNAIKESLKLGEQPKPEKSNDFITRHETASILKISLVTLHHWTKRGYIQGYKISTRIRFKRSEVLKLVEDGSLTKYSIHNK